MQTARGDYGHIRVKNPVRALVSLLVLTFALLVVAKALLVTPPRIAEVVYQPIVVQDGDSLWRLAERTGLAQDTRTLVYQIMKYNGLIDSTIHPGQVIYVPVTVSGLASAN